jgi:hypothetical protein
VMSTANTPSEPQIPPETSVLVRGRPHTDARGVGALA